MSAGLYTCSALAEVQLEADRIWADSAKKKSYIAKVGALEAIRKESNVRFDILEDSEKDRQVKLYWLDNCETSTTACTDECTVAGSETGSTCKTYSLNICRNFAVRIEEKGFRAIANTFEEAIAVQMLRAMKTLDEYLAVQVINALNSNKGANAYTGGKGTVSGFETTIPAAYWNASLFSYLHLVAEKNKMFDPYILSGTNLYEAYWNAQMNSGNSEGKGAANMFDSYRLYFDLFNLDSTLSPEQSTFLIDRSAITFVSKNYYPFKATDTEAYKYGGVGSQVGLKYHVESFNLPGVFYDVTYKVTCVSNKIYHDWNFSVNAGVFTNPVGCDLGNTGILKFKCS